MGSFRFVEPNIHSNYRQDSTISEMETDSIESPKYQSSLIVERKKRIEAERSLGLMPLYLLLVPMLKRRSIGIPFD